jgi:hypothetical protein
VSKVGYLVMARRQPAAVRFLSSSAGRSPPVWC